MIHPRPPADAVGAGRQGDECYIGSGDADECHTYGVAPDAPAPGSYVLTGIEPEERVADPETGGAKWVALGGYSVSSLGRVRRDAPQRGATPGRILRQTLRETGYLTVSLSASGAVKTKKVHALVAEAFLGPRPPGMDVCHNNGIRTDNRAENLRYDTRAGNLSDRLAHGRPHRGEAVGSAILTERAAREVLARKGQSPAAAVGREYGVASRTVRDIWERKTWKHLGGM